MDNGGDDNAQLCDLKVRHSRERKEVQARITAMKHEAPKNDKRRKKDVIKQCEQLEAEMQLRHDTELEELSNRISKAIVTIDEEKGVKQEPIRDTNTSYTNGDVSTPKESAPFFKEVTLTKAQLKKERKRAEKAAMRNRVEAEDAENAQYSPGTLESEELAHVLADRKLRLVEVAPDGDCLYSALSHQISLTSTEKFSALDLRLMAADYIQNRQKEFLPFLIDEQGEPLNELEFDEYCSKVMRICANGGKWGGEAELRALSLALKRRIEVLHANGRVNEFDSEFSGKPLVVTYHQFAYTLGEHYNSTAPKLIEK